MLASVWKIRPLIFFFVLWNDSFFSSLFPFPVWPLLQSIEMETIGSSHGKWIVWKHFGEDNLLKYPLSDSQAYFRYVETGLSVVCLTHLGANVLYLNFTLLTWLHNTENTTSSPPSSSSSTWKTLPFLFLSATDSDSKTQITRFAIVVSCSLCVPAVLIKNGHRTFPASL